MCADRLRRAWHGVRRGLPAGATITGDRDALIAEARKRIADDPGEYNEHIYGVDRGRRDLAC